MTRREILRDLLFTWLVYEVVSPASALVSSISMPRHCRWSFSGRTYRSFMSTTSLNNDAGSALDDRIRETVGAETLDYSSRQKQTELNNKKRRRQYAKRPRSKEDEDAKYQTLLDALRRYHSQYRNLQIPEGFIVPRDSTWPEEVQGWRLARRVYSMKFWQGYVCGNSVRRDELEALGFVWGRLQPLYNLFVEALTVYGQLMGDFNVPRTYVTPDVEPWPQELQGMRLGHIVARVRSDGIYIKDRPERWYQLHNMGFMFDSSEYAFQKAFAGLSAYRSITNSTGPVPTEFIVPNTEPWPVHIWGMPLGRRLWEVRRDHRYIKNHPGRITKLNDAAFQWQTPGDMAFAKIIKATKTYKAIHGHVKVPLEYKIPKTSIWPSDLHGLALGQILGGIRTKGYYIEGGRNISRQITRTSQLRLLGVLSPPGREGRLGRILILVDALKTYMDLHNGSTFVPQRFVVPSEPPWPECAWGLKLGARLGCVIAGKVAAAREPEARFALSELGIHVPDEKPDVTDMRIKRLVKLLHKKSPLPPLASRDINKEDT